MLYQAPKRREPGTAKTDARQARGAKPLAPLGSGRGFSHIGRAHDTVFLLHGAA
jgi:hypothetical protein